MEAASAKPSDRRVLAALLSLPFPGLGHAARGHFARGAAWLVVDVAALALFITHPHLWLVGALGARLLSAADAVIARPAQRGPAGGGIVAAAFGVWLGAQVVARLPIMVIAETFKLPSNSMAPTMVLGDHFTVLTTATPARGDIVTFRHRARTFVKRVIGVAGDVVDLYGTTLRLDGKVVSRELATPCTYDDLDLHQVVKKRCVSFEETLGQRRYRVIYDPATAVHLSKKVTVPAGHVYLMGDNRDNSFDSRLMGPIKLSDVTGVAISIWWSAGPNGTLWRRIGTRLR